MTPKRVNGTPDEWDPEGVKQLRPDMQHFAWLEHELRYHQDPTTQRIIREIQAMLRPEEFMVMQIGLDLAQKGIHDFLKASGMLGKEHNLLLQEDK